MKESLLIASIAMLITSIATIFTMDTFEFPIYWLLMAILFTLWHICYSINKRR